VLGGLSADLCCRASCGTAAVRFVLSVVPTLTNSERLIHMMSEPKPIVEEPNGDEPGSQLDSLTAAKIGSIHGRWNQLTGGGWDPRGFAELYRDVQALVELCDERSLEDIGEEAMNLEVYLCSFLDVVESPNAEHQELIGSFLTKLGGVELPAPKKSAEANRPVPVEPSLHGDSRDVLILSDSAEVIPGLGQALEQKKFRVQCFATVGAILAQIENLASATLVIDEASIDAFNHECERMGLQIDLAASRFPLVVVSAKESLARQLAAMRAGAAAFYTAKAGLGGLLHEMEEFAGSVKRKPYRVLIVEDDPSQAIYAEKILQKAGMETRSVTVALQTIEALREFQPELILMDIHMPEADGLELTRVIRGHSRFANIPIVFLSGETDEDTQFDVLSVGGDDLLIKPIRPRHLISAVASRVDRARVAASREGPKPEQDRITKLLNRRAFLERLDGALVSGAAEKGGVLFIEQNFPPGLREKLGLDGMDELLAKLGASIAGSCGSSDLVARIGDYNFAVMALRNKSAAVSDLAKALKKHVTEELFEVAGTAVSVELFIGICLFSSATQGARNTIFQAERACEAARETVNGVQVFLEPTDSVDTDQSDAEVVTLVQRALDEEGFQVLFQPMAALGSSERQPYQALLRMRDQNGELVAANRLIPAAEGTGQILEVDRWITRYVIQLLRDNQSSSQGVALFISQSAASLNDKLRIQSLKTLDPQSVAPHRLVCEFSVHEVAASFKTALPFFEQLRRLGVDICLSHFLEEASALKLLERTPTTYVKVAAEVVDGPQGELAALVKQVHNAGRLAIVPMVEDAAMAAKAMSAGADYVQGYFVQRPDEALSFDIPESVL